MQMDQGKKISRRFIVGRQARAKKERKKRQDVLEPFIGPLLYLGLMQSGAMMQR